MRHTPVVLVLLLTLLSAPPARGQDPAACPVKLSQNTLLRQGVLRITVQNPPKDARKAVLRLDGVRSFNSPELTVTGGAGTGTVEFPVPADLPLGRYAVTLILGQASFAACEPLRVVPALNWEAKLTRFEPAPVYATGRETERLAGEERARLKHLGLRGAGFLTEHPRDNVIIINGETQDVRWEGGQQAERDQAAAGQPVGKAGGTGKEQPAAEPVSAAPQPAGGGATREPVPGSGPQAVGEPAAGGRGKVAQLRGKVTDSERIELYGIPVPPGGVLQVALRQGDSTTPPLTFTVYRWCASQVATASATIAVLLALLVLALVRVFIKAQPRESDYNALQVLFLDAETDSYSLSKFQFYWWTAAALFGYSYLVISKIMVQGGNWPDIPTGLPGIIAIGAGTSVGAQVVTNLRGPKGSGSERPSLGDLVTSGGVAAADRVQMLVWTVLGVGIFCMSVLKHEPGLIQSLDPVPEGMLSIMGLSAAGYLGGKFARKPGPVINEISITPSESDDAVGSGARLPAAPPNLSQPAAAAQGVLQGFGATPPAGAAAALEALGKGVELAAGAKSAADAQALVGRLPELQAKAEAAAQGAAEAFRQAGAGSDAERAAQVAQQAAAALQDLASSVSSAVSAALAVPAQGEAPRFTRVIELRGRTLSADALVEIDGEALSFRMLRRVGNDAGKPEVVLREQDDPNLARVLRFTIDPWQLEAPDLAIYKGWFGTSDPDKKKTFTIINPDGQKSDLGFTVPPAAGQSSVKTGQDADQPAPAGPGGDR